jgi:hypothetical protein
MYKGILLLLAIPGLVWAFPPRRPPEPPTQAKIKVECAALVYLLPFEFDTLVPLRPGAMSRQYNISSCVKDRALGELLSILDAAQKGQFDETCVRLSVQLPNGKRYFVDQVGGIRIDGKEHKLGDADFKRFKQLLYGSLPIIGFENL